MDPAQTQRIHELFRLESLGVIVGSNSAFESVARVLTSGNSNQEKGAILNPTGNGAESSQLTSDTDAAGTLVGSSAAGTVTIGDAQVAIDLTTDSLNAIRDKINAAGPTGVTAVVNVVGPSDFVLEIQGTTDFERRVGSHRRRRCLQRADGKHQI